MRQQKTTPIGRAMRDKEGRKGLKWICSELTRQRKPKERPKKSDSKDIRSRLQQEDDPGEEASRRQQQESWRSAKKCDEMSEEKQEKRGYESAGNPSMKVHEQDKTRRGYSPTAPQEGSSPSKVSPEKRFC